jgi:hypothetical protein
LVELPRTHLLKPSRRREQNQSVGEEAEEREIREASRIHALAGLGALGKAARILDSGPATFVPPAEEVMREIRRLYPQEPPHGLPEPPPLLPVVNVTPKQVHRIVMRGLARGAAPGIDGWTRELLMPLVHDASLLGELTELVRDMLLPRVNPSFAFLVRATPGFTLRKPNGKFRPINPESVLAKLASAVGRDLIPKDYLESFLPLQHGIGGDVELAAKTIMTKLDEEGSGVFLDGSNAYGSLFRRIILEEIYSTPELRSLHGLTTWLLHEDGFMGFYSDGKLQESYMSTRGIRQGMLLGPLYYCVGIQRRIKAVMEPYPRVSLVMYLDDIALTGRPEDVEEATPAVVNLLRQMGIEVNLEKCTSYFAAGAPAGWVIPTAEGILRVLGVGRQVSEEQPGALHRWVMAKAKKQEGFFEALASPHLHAAVSARILRVCGLPRMNFLIRTHAPEVTTAACEWFDARALGALESIIGCRLDDRARGIAQIPCCKGGLGIRVTARTAQFASECVGLKHEQKRRQEAVDNALLTEIQNDMSGQQKSWMQASARSTAPLVSDGCILPDTAFRTWAKQRLFLRVLPIGAVCGCGEDANNTHVLTCPRLSGNPKIARRASSSTKRLPQKA